MWRGTIKVPDCWTTNNRKQKGNTMTTDNNNNDVPEEIINMISELIDNASMASPLEVEPEEPEEPDDNLETCSNCHCDIDTDNEWFIRGRTYRDRSSYWRQDRGFTGDRGAIPDDELVFCDGCAVSCEDCSEAIMDHNAYAINNPWETRRICSRCHSGYSECSRCGYEFYGDDMTWISPDDSYDYGDTVMCNDCHSSFEYENTGQFLHNYGWQPSERRFWFVTDWNKKLDAPNVIRFGGLASIANLDGWLGYESSYADVEAHKNQLFFGAEIETNRAKHDIHLNNIMEEFLNSVPRNSGLDIDPEDYLYLKEDASINGFEIVTMPATLDAHKLLLPRDGFRFLSSSGMVSWRTGSNGNGAGIHVHVSKASFSHSHLHKFQMFHYMNSEWLKRFAGRDSRTYASFTRTSTRYGDEVKLSHLAKGAYSNDLLARYHALNFMPHRTVELRYFRGSLRPETVLAIFEIVHAMWRYTMIQKSRDIYGDKFSWGAFRAWVAQQSEYEFLIPTMDARSV